MAVFHAVAEGPKFVKLALEEADHIVSWASCCDVGIGLVVEKGDESEVKAASKYFQWAQGVL